MRIIPLIIFFLIYLNLSAQQKKVYKNDIGINVTSLLSEVIGLGNNNTNVPTFNLTYRRSGNNKAFRISAHAGLDKSSDFNSNTGTNIFLEEKDFRLRLGFEKHLPLSQKFTLIYGLDVLGTYETSLSESSTGFENDIKIISAGAGPVIRFEYKLSDRISLMTESTLYFIKGNESDVVKFFGQVQTSSDNSKYSLTTQIPSVLFLNVHF